tara:strand:- start:171 stop:794 length:624 start_codon:yes stop_codon:yes gene_type:complete
MYFRKKDISELLLDIYTSTTNQDFFINYKNDRHFLKLNFQKYEKEIWLDEFTPTAIIESFLQELSEKLPMVNHLIPQDENLYDVLDKLFENDMYECLIPEGDKTVKDNVDKIYEILIKEFPILKKFGSQKIFIDKIGLFFDRFTDSAVGFSIIWLLIGILFGLFVLIFIDGPALQIEKLFGLDRGLAAILIVFVGYFIFNKINNKNR